MTKKIRRREFIKLTAAGAVVVGSAPLLHSSCATLERKTVTSISKASIKKIHKGELPSWSPLEPVISDIKSDLAIVTHSKSVSGKGKLNPPIVRTMMDEGMKTLCQEKSSKEAWETIFPELSSSDTIGIKIGTVNPRLAIPPEFIDIITDNLIGMGVLPNNIIIWDSTYGPIVGLRDSAKIKSTKITCFN